MEEQSHGRAGQSAKGTATGRGGRARKKSDALSTHGLSAVAGLDGDQKSLIKPESEPEEEEVIDGLTLYEMHREPLTPVMDDTTTSLQIRTLNVELTCPVCLGIIRRTMTVMECLHRFCSDCISKCLRWGKKECPTCRVHCSSRRHLRPDPNFDALIASVYPDLDEYEAQEDSFIADINKSLNRKALTESIERGIRRQAAATRPNRKRKATTAPTPTVPSSSSPAPSARNPRATKKPKGRSKSKGNVGAPAPGPAQADQTPAAPDPDHYHIRKKKHLQSGDVPQDPYTKPEWVNFIFFPHPNEKTLHELDKKYLKMKRTATIRHLTLFLLQKFPHLGPEGIPLREDSFRVSIKSTITDQYVVLSKETTLGTVETEHWNKREDMVLMYSLCDTPTSDPHSQ